MNKINELKKMIKDLVEICTTELSGMNELKEWDSVKEILENIKGLANILKQVALIALVASDAIHSNLGEEFSDDDIIDTVKDYLDDAIRLPIYLEWLDDIIIDLMIDGAMAGAKKLFDKDDKQVRIIKAAAKR